MSDNIQFYVMEFGIDDADVRFSHLQSASLEEFNLISEHFQRVNRAHRTRALIRADDQFILPYTTEYLMQEVLEERERRAKEEAERARVRAEKNERAERKLFERLKKKFEPQGT